MDVNTQWLSSAKNCCLESRGIQLLKKSALQFGWALIYLLGKPFIVQTDHCALEWLDKMKDTNARWSLALQSYQYTLLYCKRSANANADALLSKHCVARGNNNATEGGRSGRICSQVPRPR